MHRVLCWAGFPHLNTPDPTTAMQQCHSTPRCLPATCAVRGCLHWRPAAVRPGTAPDTPSGTAGGVSGPPECADWALQASAAIKPPISPNIPTHAAHSRGTLTSLRIPPLAYATRTHTTRNAPLTRCVRRDAGGTAPALRMARTRSSSRSPAASCACMIDATRCLRNEPGRRPVRREAHRSLSVPLTRLRSPTPTARPATPLPSGVPVRSAAMVTADSLVYDLEVRHRGRRVGRFYRVLCLCCLWKEGHWVHQSHPWPCLGDRCSFSNCVRACGMGR